LILLCSCDADASAHAFRSKSPSHVATTTAATALPMVLVIARANDMKRSMPISSARPSARRPAVAIRNFVSLPDSRGHAGWLFVVAARARDLHWTGGVAGANAVSASFQDKSS
jgi:hypothetical protein